MVSSKQALVGVGLVGALAFLSTRASAEPVGEVMGCTNDKADNYNPKASQDDGSCKFTLTPIEKLIPDNLSEDSVWKSDGLVVRLEHPLAATNDKYKKYYFQAKLVIDVMQSGAYKTWAEVPETFTGDYTWNLTRHGGTWLDKWTQESNAEDIRGSLSKTLLTSPVDGIKPTFDSVLNAFGGYVPNYPAVNMGQVQIQSGNFSDTGGQYRYVNPKGFKVSNQQIVLGLNGNQINPEPLQMQVKCAGSSSWTNVQSPVVVIGSLISENENGTVKFFPADAITGSLPSGLIYGCSIPTESKTLPKTIRVVEDKGSSTFGLLSSPTQISIDDVVAKTTVSVPKGKDHTSNDRVIYDRLFSSVSFPMVHKDGGGYYVLNKHNNYNKVYISSLIPTFNASYARRQVQCQCVGGTVKAGQTITIYDTKQCNNTSPSFVNKCGGFGSSSGGGNTGDNTGGLGGGLGGGSIEGSSGGLGGNASGVVIMAETVINSFNSYQV